jgi:cold shock CspA family protein
MTTTKKGIIHELGERSSGLIRQVGIKEHIFFHADALVNMKFLNLKKGDKVCFTVVESKKGPYAVEVTKG